MAASEMNNGSQLDVSGTDGTTVSYAVQPNGDVVVSKTEPIASDNGDGDAGMTATTTLTHTSLQSVGPTQTAAVDDKKITSSDDGSNTLSGFAYLSENEPRFNRQLSFGLMCDGVIRAAGAQGLLTTGIVELKVVKKSDNMKAQLNTLVRQITDYCNGTKTFSPQPDVPVLVYSEVQGVLKFILDDLFLLLHPFLETEKREVALCVVDVHGPLNDPVALPRMGTPAASTGQQRQEQQRQEQRQQQQHEQQQLLFRQRLEQQQRQQQQRQQQQRQEKQRQEQQRQEQQMQEQQRQEQFRDSLAQAAQTGNLEQLISIEEGDALIAYANVDDQNSYADSHYWQAFASGIAVANFRQDFLAYRGANDARLTIRLYMALWEAAGRPDKRDKNRIFRDFLQRRERQRRSACSNSAARAVIPQRAQ
jgi:hypothetical protein